MEAIFWPTLLLVLGLGLLVAEFFLPTGGVLGVLATASLLGSFYLARMAPIGGYWWAACEIALVASVWVGAVYGLPRTRLGRRIYLPPPTAVDLQEERPAAHPAGHLGRSGRALTPLRPSGTIDLGGRRCEAMAEFGLIGAGATVTVVAVRSGRAIVREI